MLRGADLPSSRFELGELARAWGSLVIGGAPMGAVIGLGVGLVDREFGVAQVGFEF